MFPQGFSVPLQDTATLSFAVWDSWAYAGAFCWSLYNGVGGRSRNFGGRLVLIPTKDSAVYTANIAAWKQKMAA